MHIMSKHLWTVTATKDWSKIVKGMNVEILVENKSSKPYTTAIAEAFSQKYGLKNLPSSGMPDSIFDFEEG